MSFRNYSNIERFFYGRTYSKNGSYLINYSTEVKPGERVLIRSTSPAGEPLCQALYARR